MRLRFFVVSLLLAFLLMGGTAFSQTFTGLVDGYYAYNFNKPTNQTNSFRAFDVNSQQFSLNYAELSIEQKGKPVGYRFDLGFGDTAEIVHATEPAGVNVYHHIQQAYVSIARENMTLDFGKFVTPLGAEVIETKDNWNYSRGLLFTYAIPFYHFGARMTYAASDKATLGAYVTNGWNNVRENNKGKSIGLTVTLKPAESLILTENYIMGNESQVEDNRRHTLDSITTWEANKVFSLMANYDYAFDTYFGVRRRWQGIAFYGKISPNGADTGFKIVPRYEIFDDRKAQLTGLGQKIQEGTVTLQMVSKESGTFWAEYRRDWSDQRAFALTKPTGNVPRFNQDTVLFGYTYSFTKEIK